MKVRWSEDDDDDDATRDGTQKRGDRSRGLFDVLQRRWTARDDDDDDSGNARMRRETLAAPRRRDAIGERSEGGRRRAARVMALDG